MNTGDPRDKTAVLIHGVMRVAFKPGVSRDEAEKILKEGFGLQISKWNRHTPPHYEQAEVKVEEGDEYRLAYYVGESDKVNKVFLNHKRQFHRG